MLTRSQLIHAHRFVQRRLTSALLRADPDAPETPHRRQVTTTVVAVVVAVLTALGVGVYGWLRPTAGDGWRDGRTLVVDRGTGARYVFGDGRLHPVVNYTSALLVLGQAQPPLVRVDVSRLRDAPIGEPVGIVGAPEEVPPPTAFTDAAWVVCSGRDTTATRPRVVVRIGAAATGPAVAGDEGVVVRSADRSSYLVTGGRRHRLAAPWVARALGLATAHPVDVGQAWLDALPQGPDLAPVRPDRTGEAGPDIGGQASRVGQVVRVETGPGDQAYVVLPDGLAPLTATQAVLLLADPASTGAYAGGKVEARRVTAAEVSAAPQSAAVVAGGDLPAHPPRPVADVTGGLCATYPVAGPDATVQLWVDPAFRPTSPGTQEPGPEAAAAGGGAVADEVRVAGGRAVLAERRAPDGASTGVQLVMEPGLRYPVATAEELAALGLDGASAVVVPDALVRIVPPGPVLRRAAATRFTGAPVQG